MSDNKLEIGLDANDEGLKRALEQANAGISKIGSTLQGLQTQMNQAFGQTALGSINNLTQSLDRLFSLLNKIQGVTGGIGASLEGAIGGAGQLVDQYGRPISMGGQVGGSAGGGGGPTGGAPGGMGMSGGVPVVASAPNHGALSVAGMIPGIVSGAASAATEYMYNYPIASVQRDMFGMRQASSGRVSGLMAKGQVDASGSNSLLAGVTSYGLPGMMIAGGIGALALGIGSPLLALTAAGVGAYNLMKGPSNYETTMKSFYEKTLAKTPLATETFDSFADYANLAGRSAQLYGNTRFNQMLGSSAQFGGKEEAADYLRRASAAGIFASDTDAGAAGILRARLGGGGNERIATSLGIGITAGDITNYRKTLAQSGMFGANTIAERNMTGDVFASTIAASGQVYETAGELSERFTRTAAYAGGAMDMGLKGANFQQAVAGAERVGEQLKTNPIVEMRMFQQLAGMGLSQTEAAEIIALDPTNPGNQDKIRRIITGAGKKVSDEQFGSLFSTSQDIQKSVAGNLQKGMSASFISALESETGQMAGAGALTGDEKTAKALSLFARGGKQDKDMLMEAQFATQTDQDTINQNEAQFTRQQISSMEENRKAISDLMKTGADDLVKELIKQMDEVAKKAMELAAQQAMKEVEMNRAGTFGGIVGRPKY